MAGGDELTGEVLKRYMEMLGSGVGVGAYAAATLVLAAELRGLRKDLRSAQTADLTELVDRFRAPLPGVSEAAQRAAEVGAGGVRVLEEDRVGYITELQRALLEEVRQSIRSEATATGLLVTKDQLAEWLVKMNRVLGDDEQVDPGNAQVDGEHVKPDTLDDKYPGEVG